mmetsp:Transcript_46247/g.110235  ORF Transcript_46247/g.110235 Transcript_46247/m.110235 type:complete len:353 (-) Transcript_46247:285-1343(-)
MAWILSEAARCDMNVEYDALPSCTRHQYSWLVSSSAVWIRSSDRFRNALANTMAKGVERRWRRDSGASSRTSGTRASMSPAISAPAAKTSCTCIGSTPVTSSYSVIASDQTSDAKERVASGRKASGAAYEGVPAKRTAPSVTCVRRLSMAMRLSCCTSSDALSFSTSTVPRSMSVCCPPADRIMFEGLISRCRTPSSWMAFRPAHTSSMILMASACERGPSLFSRSCNEGPASFSMMSQNTALSLDRPDSMSFTTLGEFTRSSSAASRWRRRMESSERRARPFVACTSFTARATVINRAAPVFFCTTSSTVPSAPDPNTSSARYLERSTCGRSRCRASVPAGASTRRRLARP